MYTILYHILSGFILYFKFKMDFIGKQFSVVDFIGKLSVVSIEL